MLQKEQYIVVEGPIGVGKTSLAKRLADTLGHDTLLEKPEENPFLERFYQSRRLHALSTQLFFLFQRARQIEELKQGDMFRPGVIADFMLEKDTLFAEVNLDNDEFKLYQQVYEHLKLELPQPDLVIYLQAPVNVLWERLHRRGNKRERGINKEYLQALSEAYTRFFHQYSDAPLLIVNAAEINIVDNDDDFGSLLDYAGTVSNGRHFYNPIPSVI